MKTKKYRLTKDLPGLNLLKGYVFEYNKNGYRHFYNDGDWIGLPEWLVEESAWFDEVEEPKMPEMEEMKELATELFKKADKLVKDLKKYDR